MPSCSPSTTKIIIKWWEYDSLTIKNKWKILFSIHDATGDFFMAQKCGGSEQIFLCGWFLLSFLNLSLSLRKVEAVTMECCRMPPKLEGERKKGLRLSAAHTDQYLPELHLWPFPQIPIGDGYHGIERGNQDNNRQTVPLQEQKGVRELQSLLQSRIGLNLPWVILLISLIIIWLALSRSRSRNLFPSNSILSHVISGTVS